MNRLRAATQLCWLCLF